MQQAKEINNWKDVEEFKGQIVALKTNIYYFRGTPKMSKQYAMIAMNPSLWQCDGQGYNMSMFKKRSETSGNRALINEFLRTGVMTMRLTSDSELEQLISQLKDDQYGFEYYDNKYSIKKVESQLRKH